MRTSLICGAWAALAAGCLGTDTPRLQSDDADSGSSSRVRTVGDVARFSGVEPVAVGGIGLVYGLDGTGHSPPGPDREALARDMKLRRVDNVRQILDSPNYATVLVSGLIPAGSRKGDPVTVQVHLPRGSQATSLRGGKLAMCELRPYRTAGQLSKRYEGTGAAGRVVMGHVLVKAKGPLTLTGAGEDEGKVAVVWDGGANLKERYFYIVPDPDHQQARMAMRLADRVNGRFHGGPGGGERYAEAKPQGGLHVLLRVPPQYRHNAPRFLRVVRHVPLSEVPAGHAYRGLLREELYDPRTAVAAAMKLEALGPNTASRLRAGLDSRHWLVRFACAESLAYMGDAAGVTELAALAREHPEVRAYSLAALVALNNPAARTRLSELQQADDVGLRVGAFQALRLLEAVKPTESSVYRVAGDGGNLVHVRRDGRPELSLFGPGPRLLPPFRQLAGRDFTVAVANDTCAVTRFAGDRQTERRCGAELAAVLKTMTELGATYDDLLDLVTKADATKGLNCPLVSDAKPSSVPVAELASLARAKPKPAGE